MVATHSITIHEFERMALDGRWELIDGEPIELTPSADESSSTGATILGLLWSHVHPRGLGRLYGSDGGFVLFPDRETVRVPDVAFVRAERAPRGKARKSFPRLAPDLVVEVLSPSDRASEVVAKLETYQEAGVPLIWLVDPENETVTIIAAGHSTRVLKQGDTLEGGDVLPEFSVPVAEIFS
ncbi:MAG TPA: Uma2 family endonuclease [Thermomicrobiales bacterium]|nr:Uma2 family endonuclease [Thermomicrobiales bacterium]